jgi:tRNA(fMet)-specific endonuclease VapC
MIYLLDTNAWIAVLNPGDSPVKSRLSTHQPDEIVLCSIVKAELFFGAYRSTKQAANLQLLERLYRQFRSVPFDDAAAAVYGRIRADLAARGTPIGPNDLMIAAIAIAHGLTLVTNNTREFARVAGLRLEDWA